MNSQAALFLDRNGAINIDHAYVYKKEDFEFIDGIFSLCQKANQLGYLIFHNNQAGSGRDYYTETDFLALTNWMLEAFSRKGVDITKVYFFPYHPTHGIGKYRKDATCRKPNPGMILQAQREYNVDLSKSLLVGNKQSDIQAGLSAKINLNLLYNKKGSLNTPLFPNICSTNHLSLIQQLLH
ncbi:MAG: D-glycero-beta-D-manno-heptose 1,7-bisphosphate 7-phosphatase [Gammaproteobacteria bacterium]|nr:D-glycero-beta-D-manno-heptose 1,7-bisphosphate 7-phosphatase [Gammaproteobacteria bacterium]